MRLKLMVDLTEPTPAGDVEWATDADFACMRDTEIVDLLREDLSAVLDEAQIEVRRMAPSDPGEPVVRLTLEQARKVSHALHNPEHEEHGGRCGQAGRDILTAAIKAMESDVEYLCALASRDVQSGVVVRRAWFRDFAAKVRKALDAQADAKAEIERLREAVAMERDKTVLAHAEAERLKAEHAAAIERLNKLLPPMSKRATGRTIPDMTGIEHICQWQNPVSSKEADHAAAIEREGREVLEMASAYLCETCESEAECHAETDGVEWFHAIAGSEDQTPCDASDLRRAYAERVAKRKGGGDGKGEG